MRRPHSQSAAPGTPAGPTSAIVAVPAAGTPPLVLAPSPSLQPIPTRAIALLAVASFSSAAMVRASDTLLPQIAADLGVTVGAASIVVTAYALMHGTMQLFAGPIGDRFGKYVCIAAACAGSAVVVLACAFAGSLSALTIARLASGITASWIIPLAMAWIGDVVPYDRRQTVLGRFLSGQIAGMLFGQAAGGVIGDHFGWRAVFVLFSALFAIAAVALVRELTTNPVTRITGPRRAIAGEFVAGYRAVLGNRWAVTVVTAVFLEGALMFGAFAYVGADLHLRFGASFTLVGAVVATFGLGGLVYAASVQHLVGRFGQIGLTLYGGTLLALAFLALGFAPAWWVAPLAVPVIGLGFYMLHNTLQTNATQMAPEARGTAVAIFSSALYLGQTSGVGLAAAVVDRAGPPAVFVAVAVLLPALALWFASRLRRRSGAAG